MTTSTATACAVGLLLASTAAQAAPGNSEVDPILPNRVSTSFVSVSGQIVGRTDRFEFDQPASGKWFDPPMVDGFTISIGSGAVFTSVTAPTSFSGLVLRVGSSIVDASFDAGETHSFGAGVSTFDILNLRPVLDPAAANFTSALPLRLSFNGSASLMLWTSLPAAVPESDIYLLMLAGLAGLGALTRRWPRRMPPPLTS